MEVGGNSWEKQGALPVTLAKCAAWPPSWNRVLRPLQPLPTWDGLARLVKLTTAGTHCPSCQKLGTGPWQKPFSYFPSRVSKSRVRVASRYWMPSRRKLSTQSCSAREKGT
ncbi:hypothetical protein D3C78_1411160 [compost metagenome]